MARPPAPHSSNGTGLPPGHPGVASGLAAAALALGAASTSAANGSACSDTGAALSSHGARRLLPCNGGADKLVAIHEAEGRILSRMPDTPYVTRDVPVPLDTGRRCLWESPKTEYSMRTVIVGREHKDRLPIVLIHGYMMGAPAFFKLLPYLARERTVYVVDIIGMGGSERPPFDARRATAEESEQLFVDAFEGWARSVGLEEFALLGHSFGGYVAACWATRHPGRVRCLGLLSPLLGWSDEKIASIEDRMGDSLWRHVVDAAWAHHITPHSLVRRIPWFKTWLKGSNERRFQGMASDVTEEEGRLLSEYVVASMDMPASTERAATVCFEKWLKAHEGTTGTIKQRLAGLDVPMFAVYGERDWMEAAKPVELPGCSFFTLPGSGHHLYFDNPAGLAAHIFERLAAL